MASPIPLPSFSLPTSLTKTLRLFSKGSILHRAPSPALCISQQAQGWVTQTCSLCLGRQFALGEVNTSSKPLQELPFRPHPASPPNQYRTSLTPDGPSLGSAPEQIPSQPLIQSISAAPPFRKAALSCCSARFPLFAHWQLGQHRKRVILPGFSPHNLTIRS